MTPPVKFLLILVGIVATLFAAASVPWKSRTIVDIRVTDTEGHPLPGARISLITAQGGVLAEGSTDENGVLVLSRSPDENTDWGKLVWRFSFFLDGYVANETPVRIREETAGTFRGWIPALAKAHEKPHLRFVITARFVCKKIT